MKKTAPKTDTPTEWLEDDFSLENWHTGWLGAVQQAIAAVDRGELDGERSDVWRRHFKSFDDTFIVTGIWQLGSINAGEGVFMGSSQHLKHIQELIGSVNELRKKVALWWSRGGGQS